MNLDFIDTTKKKNVAKSRYIKPDALRELERMYHAEKVAMHTDIKQSYIPKTAFRDDTANGLTKCITAYLQLNGYFAARVNTTGTYSHKLGKYIHSGSTKGMADITAVVGGKHISIEVKAGRDKARPEQLKVKSDVEAAGGVYIFVRSFDDFLEQFTNFVQP